jgi:hypothetical protein
MAAKSKAIVASTFTALTPQGTGKGRLSPEELKESLGAARPSISDLDRIRVPAGGSTMFQTVNEKGEEDEIKQFQAVIIAAQDVRIFYATKYSGGNEPPDCMSLDLIHGLVGEDCPPDVTGECATCPKSKWGTAVNDKGELTKGKACSERKQMLLFREHDLIPVFMSIPPTSLKEVQSYISRLVPTGEAYYTMVTKFSLRKEKNDNGIAYSQVVCEPVRPLNDAEFAAVKALRLQWVAAVERSPEAAVNQ